MTGRLLAAVAAAAMVAACATAAPAPSSGASGNGGAVREDAAPGVRVQQTAGALNRVRIREGCPELRWDARAAAAAQAHSDDMARRNFFSHTSPDGRGPVDRLRAQGVTGFAAVAENIARTSGGAREVVALWLNSPNHRDNIVNCQFTHHGLAVSGDRWTHVFLALR